MRKKLAAAGAAEAAGGSGGLVHGGGMQPYRVEARAHITFHFELDDRPIITHTVEKGDLVGVYEVRSDAVTTRRPVQHYQDLG